MNTKIKEWVFLANEDIRLAEVAFQAKIYHGACFHSQQAAEKAIKAYLLSKLGKTPKIHQLTGLLDTDKKTRQLFENLIEEIEFIDQFYIPTRYPDAFPGSLKENLPTEEDARKALTYTKDIYNLVIGLLENHLHPR